MQAVQQVMQSGEVLSDEFQGMLAQTLSKLLEKIDQEGKEVPLSPPTSTTPPLEPGPYPSSNVNAFKYDPTNGTLFVKFHGKDSADSGPVYRYQNVPLNIYDVFSKGRVAPRTSGQNRYHRWIKGVTPSLGASLYALIREGGYDYQKVS
jgi:hypothetical protein